MKSIVPELTLNNGIIIPQLGFGLWRNADPKECIVSVKAALAAGYTHIDGAQVYDNEKFVGQALQEAGVDRSKLFITTKIGTENLWWTDVIPSFKESLRKLQMDYVDLLLIHFPVTERRDAAWRRLEQIYAKGQAKAIGVSNYTVKHLKEMKTLYDITPAVNQVEMSVFLQQPELVEYCKANNIVVEAYTPLAEGLFFEDPTLQAIAKKHSKSVPQIMLRWGIEYGVVVLTKSSHEKRIHDNLDIFDFSLDAKDMEKLKKLNRGYRTNWNPTNVA
jgi:diketogulonate reductase-like aldo/keto reductase